ncbi:MinD/ParA family protein [Rhodococcus sp. 1R11]|uniref:MinD/ParA family ATP-binding protein n=1 Tax=Rhodococcus sp. 1R11 TaxID=2559614 RepID=UPI001FD6D176|nr:MinD/ParA family protein [Rhodococcus sp. 1R11]
MNGARPGSAVDGRGDDAAGSVPSEPMSTPRSTPRQPPPWQTPDSAQRPPVPPRYNPPVPLRPGPSAAYPEAQMPPVPPVGDDRYQAQPAPWAPQPWAGAPNPYRPSSQDLAADSLLKRPKRTSSSGWRRGVHRLTGGVINPGESTAEERYRNQVDRIRQPVLGDYRIAFLSLKGGVGKTTTTLGLGSTFASLRGDCVVAVDANPDFGTLGERVPRQTASTVRDLLAAAPNIRRYSDIRAHTSQAPSRLEVLAGERDPSASEMFGEEDYRAVIDMLQVYYNLILTDCGTGIMHSAMNGVLQLANALVLVSSPAVDGARSAAATLDWLELHGYGHLVERTVVVISSVRPGSSAVDMNLLQQHFLERCRAVLVVPFDEHLAEGAVVDLEKLRPQTRSAFVELAAMVADDFPAASGRHSGPPR